MSGRAIRVGTATWQRDTAANSSTAPSTSAHGVAVPGGGHGEYVAVSSTKTNGADLAVWGYGDVTGGGSTAQIWVRVDSVQFTETVNEAKLFSGLAAFERIAIRRQDTNVQAQNSINAYIGTVEA